MKSLAAALVLLLATTTASRGEEEAGRFGLHFITDHPEKGTVPIELRGTNEILNVTKEPEFDEEDVESARVSQEGKTFQLVVKLKPESAQHLKRVTSESRRKQIVMFLGKWVVRAPVMREPITNGEITIPTQSQRDAETFSQLLNAVARRAVQNKRPARD